MHVIVFLMCGSTQSNGCDFQALSLASVLREKRNALSLMELLPNFLTQLSVLMSMFYKQNTV